MAPLPQHAAGVHESVARSIVPASQQQGMSADELVKKAMSMVGSTKFEGLCEKQVETVLGQSRASSAKEAYNMAKSSGQLRQGDAPAGSQLFFTGNSKYGHTAISVGGGYMVTSGVGGRTQKMKISDLQKLWGTKGTYLGYREPGANMSRQFKDVSGTTGSTQQVKGVNRPSAPSTQLAPSTASASMSQPVVAPSNIFGRIY